MSQQQLGQTFKSGNPQVDLVLNRLFKTLMRHGVGSPALDFEGIGQDFDNVAHEQNLYALDRWLRLPPATEKVIASGIITCDQCTHRVDTEGNAASDNLDTILGGTEGDVLVLFPENDARTIVAKHATGNLRLNASIDYPLDSEHDSLVLYRKPTLWIQLGGARL